MIFMLILEGLNQIIAKFIHKNKIKMSIFQRDDNDNDLLQILCQIHMLKIDT